MQLIIKLKSDLCVSVGKGFASMIDNDTALDEFGIPFIPSRRLKGCLRELAGYVLDDRRLGELFGTTGSDKPGSLRISDAHIRGYQAAVDEILALRKNGLCTEEVTELFCSVRRETSIENGTASDKSLRSVRVVNMYSPINHQPLEFFADIEFDPVFRADMEVLVGALRNIGYHRFRGLGAVECFLSDEKVQNNDSKTSIYGPEAFENADGIRITVRLDSDLMLPGSDANSSTDYISGSMLLGAAASKYILKHSEKDFNKYFYSDVKFGNLYPAVRKYDKERNRCFYSYTTPAPRFFAKDKITGEIFNCLGKDTAKKRKKVLKKGYMTPESAYMTPETKIVYHNANIASDDQLLYMQHCLSSGQYYSGEIIAPKDKIRTIAELFTSGELHFGRSRTAQYSHCTICELVPLTRSEQKLAPSKSSAFVLESDVCLMKNGKETVDIKDLCTELGIDLCIDSKILLPETSVSVKTVSGYNAKWNLKKPQFPAFVSGSCLVFSADALNGKTIPEYIFVGEKQNEGFGKIRFIPDAGSLKPSIFDAAYHVPEEPKSSIISDLIKEQKSMNAVIELAVQNFKDIKLNASQSGRLTLMAKDANYCQSGQYEDFKKRIENIKKDAVRDEAKKRFGDLMQLLEANQIPAEWKYKYKYILTALMLKKYQLREEGKNND